MKGAILNSMTENHPAISLKMVNRAQIAKNSENRFCHKNFFRSPILRNSGKFKECYSECSHFKERRCKRRDKVGVYKCPDNSKFDKYYYRAQQAHTEYLNTLSDARE